jgi:hypothetical protein
MGCDITDEQIPEWEWSQLVSELNERGPPSDNAESPAIFRRLSDLARWRER